MRWREVCLWVGQGNVGHQGGVTLVPFEVVIRLVFAPLPTPDGQYQKDAIPVAVGLQTFSCLIYVATIETLARGVHMSSGDWLDGG